MKTVIITGVTLFSLLFANLSGWFLTPKPTETRIPVCHSNDMATLAADPAFAALHANPLPFTYRGAGEVITFATPDGQKASGFLIKSQKPSDKWLLVYQEWWGLNDFIKQEAQKYATDLKDVNVLAVDMYDGKVATEREDAMKYMQAATKERLGSIMKGAIGYVGPKAEIASIGWCFGGMLSLQSAILEGKQAKGCVMYYGQPEQDVAKLKTLDTDVLGIFGSQDQGIPPATVEKFEKNMKDAGEKIEVKMYDANHAFANPSNPVYNKEAAEDAYKRSLSYLKSHLKA